VLGRAVLADQPPDLVVVVAQDAQRPAGPGRLPRQRAVEIHGREVAAMMFGGWPGTGAGEPGSGGSISGTGGCPGEGGSVSGGGGECGGVRGSGSGCGVCSEKVTSRRLS
jgi:hypothetical protein